MALLSQSLMLLLISVGASFGQFQFCPPREDILPCTCTVNEDQKLLYQVKVFCWKVDDVDDLRRALQSLKWKMMMVSVEIKDSRLGTVPSDLFEGIAVTELTFDHCVLKRIGNVGRPAVEGMPVQQMLKKFTVKWSFSERNPLTFLNVSRMDGLEFLDITVNEMKELGDEWFAEGPMNLRELHISVNEISKLGDRAFAQLLYLTELGMGYNKIETLKRSMFPLHASFLKDISLYNNKITSLPMDLFSNMPILRRVDLEKNSIQHIPEETWKPVWSQLTSLDLGGNPLNCDTDINWIQKEKRPRFLKGECASPYERKGVALEKIIDDN